MNAISLCKEIDSNLPGGGLVRGALHEVLATDPGAATAFCAMVLARASGSVMWISATPDAWPPGLSAFGLNTADLLIVPAERSADGLWAFEEALRSPALAGALLIMPGVSPDMVAGRRLQLAAETGGGIGLLMMADTDQPPPSPARTRWRIGALVTGDRERPCWSVTLLRCRGARPVMWERDTATLLPHRTSAATAI